MKRVTLKSFKESLSEITALAARGLVVEITKHNRPFVRLYPSTHPGLHVGSKAGKVTLESAAVLGSRGKYLKVLSEDRSDE